MDTKDGKQLSVVVELEGTNHQVMDIAEVAQYAEVIGEAGVEKVLLHILNEEEKAVEMNIEGPIH
ncbi:hypothetical protein [Halobacillus halophilus]|uniref:hypothetical protein n=1 Tax=Halobacillus halophilus TaxID=1570 RepID=UPI001CD410BC|nr:hypothetical protein [Halobacillus halophilus]MCA1012801.1 hypothetical protein [Halobacillus halophilus]